MKNNIYKAGIDYSMTCPAVCVGHVMDFTKCNVYFLTSINKFHGDFGDNIHGDLMPKKWKSNEERFDFISLWASSILKNHSVDEVCLEGYSMGSKGAVFNIGEHGGVLKNKLWMQNVKIHTPAPTEVKKFFYGKGTAKKGQMYEAFKTETGVDLPNLMNSSEEGSPISDIVDSYAMLKFGFTNLF